MQTVDKSTRHCKYNWCPNCKELWAADWMAAARVNSCPLCDTTVVKPPYSSQMQRKEQSTARVPGLTRLSRRARQRRAITGWLDVGKQLIALRRA